MSGDNFGGWVNRLEKYGWTSSGGQLTIPPELPAGNLDAPLNYTFLSDWESLEPRSVEWQVNVQLRDPGGVGSAGFPLSAQSAAFNAGAHYLSNVPPDRWDSAGFSCIVAKHELGSGPNARTIYTDLRAGRFALGIQTRVRTSVARWFHADPGPGGGLYYDVQSSVSHGLWSDADPPTFSATILMAPGRVASIASPPGALWFDASIANGETTITVNAFDFTGTKSNVPGALLCYPPTTPWPVGSAGSTFDVVNVGANQAWVTMRFWVR